MNLKKYYNLAIKINDDIEFKKVQEVLFEFGFR